MSIKTQDLGSHVLLPSQYLDAVFLVGEGVPERVKTQLEQGPVFLTAFRLVRRIIFGRELVHIEPVVQKPRGTYAFGGNYVFSSDAAGLSFPYLIPIHDHWIPNFLSLS